MRFESAPQEEKGGPIPEKQQEADRIGTKKEEWMIHKDSEEKEPVHLKVSVDHANFPSVEESMEQQEEEKRLEEKIMESFKREGLSNEEIDERITRMLKGYVKVVDGIPVAVEPTEEELKIKKEIGQRTKEQLPLRTPFPPDFTDAMYNALRWRIQYKMDTAKLAKEKLFVKAEDNFIRNESPEGGQDKVE